MTEPEDNLGLTEVRERFLEAEERLRELAQSAVNLSRMSLQLKEARMGVMDASQVLRETGEMLAAFIETLSKLSEELAGTVQWIEKSNPRALLERFDQVETGLSESAGRIEEGLEAVRTSVATDVSALGTDLASTREALLASQAELGVELAKEWESLEASASERERRVVEHLSGRFEDSTLRVLETLRRRSSEVMAAARKPLGLTRTLLILQALGLVGLAFLIYWLVFGSAG